MNTIERVQGMDRNSIAQAIRSALRRRSGTTWSVRGGEGTAWGWIRITRRAKEAMDPADCARLGELLGLDGPVSPGGESIPASTEYRVEYLDRAEGRTPAVVGRPYWD